MTNTPLQDLQKRIKVKFKDPLILHQALVHRSYLNENRRSKLENNERYEFLGDAILELWASTTLFSMFPDFPEGDLTNLRALVVRTENLADAAQKINLGEAIFLSRGEAAQGGRSNPSILADTFESLIGAIFLDRGLTAANDFLDRALKPSLLKLSQKPVFKDPKSVFQELAQAKRGITPHYRTIKELGPDHHKIFTVAVFIGNEKIAIGKGPSKQKAEENASKIATKKLSNPV